MKTVALVALLVGGVIPLAPSQASEVDPAIHKLCIEAKDDEKAAQITLDPLANMS